MAQTNDLNELLKARGITRREALRYGAALSVGFSAIGPFLEACGGNSNPTGTTAENFKGVTINVASAGTPKQATDMAAISWSARTGGQANVTEVGYGDIATKWAGIIATQDSTYDVLYAAGSQVGTYGSKLYADITGKIDLTPLVPATTKVFQQSGKQLGVPVDSEMEVFIYNKNHFSAAGVDPNNPPSTWSELIALSDKLHVGNRYASTGNWLSPSGFPARALFLIMINSTSSTLLTPDLKSVGFDNDDGRLVFKTIKDAFDAKFFDPAGLFNASSYDNALVFNQGNCASEPQFSELWGQAVSQDPKFKATISPSVVGATVMPGLRPGTSGSVNGFEGHAVNKFSTKQAAALSFLKETISPSVQKQLNLTKGGLPSCRTDTLNDPEIKQQFAVGSVMAKQGTYNLSTYDSPFAVKTWTVFGDVLTRLYRGQLDANGAHAEAVKQMKKVISDYYSA
jgi:ABC-type glycerol-3-phosphate transport system substrate-binding protein